MFRILEVVGMLAPVAGIVIMVIYRRRAASGVAWGVVGAVVALTASIVGFLGPRLSLLGGGTGSGDALLENMHSWALLRVALLLLSVVLLTVGAFSGRGGGRAPVGLLAAGTLLVVIGFVVTFVHIDFGSGSEGASEIVGLLVETVQFALLGLGVMLLCLAVVTGRSAADGRREPGQVVVGAALQAKQFYDRAHARRR